MKYIFIFFCVILLTDCQQNNKLYINYIYSKEEITDGSKNNELSRDKINFNAARYDIASDFMYDICGIYVMDTITHEFLSEGSALRNIAIVRPYIGHKSVYSIFLIRAEPYFGIPELFHFQCKYQNQDCLKDCNGDIQIDIQYKNKQIVGLWIICKNAKKLWHGDAFFSQATH